LTSIGGDLYIEDNSTLNSLVGLDNVTSVGGWLQIQYNDSLTSLTGLENVTSIGGTLTIGHNNVLTSLTGLDNVTSIGGGLSILNNNALNSLIGLDNVASIGGTLTIGHNNVLTSLTGLDNLTSIGGSLSVIGNDTLTSLTGLDAVTSIGGNLMIMQNIALTNCEVVSICTYLANPNAITFINNNATGCNSRQEVEVACGITSLDELKIFREITALPNPLTTSTTLVYTLDKPSIVTISIFNPQGQLIEKIEQEQPKGEQQIHWNAQGLPAGIYYYRIQAGDKVCGGKMVKVNDK
jgi:hypothetical protein